MREQITKLAPAALTFGIALAWHIGLPSEVANDVYSKIKEIPDLTPLGLSAYAIYLGSSIYLGVKTLEKKGFNSGIKTTAVFRMAEKFSRGKTRRNAVLAESLNSLYNILGLAHIGVIGNIVQPLGISPIEVFLAQRLTSTLLNGTFNMGLNLSLLFSRDTKSTS